MWVKTSPATLARGLAEHLRCTASRAEDIHQELDDGRLAGTVGADEGVDGVLRNGEVEALESSGAAVAAGEVLGLDYGRHLLSAASIFGSRLGLDLDWGRR